MLLLRICKGNMLDKGYLYETKTDKEGIIEEILPNHRYKLVHSEWVWQEDWLKLAEEILPDKLFEI